MVIDIDETYEDSGHHAIGWYSHQFSHHTREFSVCSIVMGLYGQSIDTVSSCMIDENFDGLCYSIKLRKWASLEVRSSCTAS